MNVYIAGAMTYKEDFNYQTFVEAAAKIKTKGHHPVHTANLPRGWEYEDYIAISKVLLKSCDAILMIKGWEYSNGANEEYKLAKELGLKNYSLEEA